MRELVGYGIPVAASCWVLGVSLSGYKDWAGRSASVREQRNTELLKVIRQIHEESRFSYGSPRVHAELTLGLGEPVNRKRVERLMREAGLQGIYRRRGRKRAPGGAATEDDLVHRGFDADAPDVLWVTDITEHPTAEGKLYCAAVLDCFSRRIVGHSIDIRQTSDLVINAMSAAVARRHPVRDKTILHSDHGTQFTSWAFGRCRHSRLDPLGGTKLISPEMEEVVQVGRAVVECYGGVIVACLVGAICQKSGLGVRQGAVDPGRIGAQQGESIGVVCGAGYGQKAGDAVVVPGLTHQQEGPLVESMRVALIDADQQSVPVSSVLRDRFLLPGAQSYRSGVGGHGARQGG
ncbi:IS3 family transposase [Actinocorallia libanotica]|uniref:IS3 family transposase n=1 Tax=Actinocorallia libanotica TaxID=46162 RepID=UPI0031D6FA6F